MKLIPTAVLTISLFLAGSMTVQSQMHGRQSHNEGIRAVPAPGPVKIDGDLSDWDLSGRIWSFADVAIRDRFSAETAMMWDAKYLYIAVHFRDPTPMVNTINPSFDPESGWKGDALQLRVKTDWPKWITLWYYTKESRAVVHHATWLDAEDNREGMDVKLLISEEGATELGHNVEMAFQEDADGGGYVQEIRLPWELLWKEVPKIEPDLTFRVGLELFWGGVGENVFPMHRYADNLQPGETAREFFWTNRRAWGDVRLMPEGNVEELVYVLDTEKLEGTIPVQARIPEDAREFTIVIEEESGRRVRNLGGQLNAELYTEAVENGERIVSVSWDGLDDRGELVAPGEYVVRGLSHEGIGADYKMSIFNPGTPPWAAGRSGSWGADHGSPRFVASAGGWTVLGWTFAEGGEGVIGIGADGKKKWGEKRGAQALAVDEESVYFIARSWHVSGGLSRLNLRNGSYKPFVLDGKERPFELPLSEVFGDEDSVPGRVVGMASSGETLAIAFEKDQIALLDPNSAELLQQIEVPAPSAVAYGPEKELYAISNGKLVGVDPDSGAISEISTPGLSLVSRSGDTEDEESASESAAPSTLPLHVEALTVDLDGNIGIFDNGADQQVKFFSPDGKFVYAAGREGGRPIRGEFDKQAMREVRSVSVDAEGNVWAAENWEYPRRVSVWGRDGKLVRDYVGNTGYAATGTFLHDSDPTIGHYGPVELKLDYDNRSWEVSNILWVPDADDDPALRISTRSHSRPQRFFSKASGEEREYVFSIPYRRSEPYVVFLSGENGWRPVAAIGLLGQISGELRRADAQVIRQPDGPFEGHNAWDGFFWNDANGDGRIQPDEVTIVPIERPVDIGGRARRGQEAIPQGNYWGTKMSSDDLSFLVNGVARYVPTGFTEEGAPIFGPESIQKLAFDGTNGDYAIVPGTSTAIALMWEQYFGSEGLYGLDLDSGEPIWSYPNPFPGVHGSHRAPMPRAGLLIGPLMILGVAELPGDLGHVFGVRGNLGQDFYLTSDGLFLTSMFQDGRLPTMALPTREEELFDAPMELHSGGGEPFSGWFGRHDDGVYRVTSPIPRQAAMVLEMNGFDTIQRFSAPSLSVDGAALARAAKDNEERAAALAAASERRQEITRVAKPLPVDGKGAGNWEKIPSFEVASPASGYTAEVQLAYDETNLYLAMVVEDPSPWMNRGTDTARLFKTGDAVDIQLATATEVGDREQPVEGDLRLLIAPYQNKNIAVLMQPVNPAAEASHAQLYSSPVIDYRFDEVRPVEEVEIGVETAARSYRIEAAIPLKSLGLSPKPGAEIDGDIGFISSDADGRINTARTYWANEATNLVNDEPFEAWLTPSRWGTFVWGE